MTEPTKMEEEETPPKSEEEEKKEETKPVPPLEAAARRIERLLGGGLTDKDSHLYTYTNPTKVIRRWLGTASGAAGNATSEDIAAAAAILLDPQGPCSTRRELVGGAAGNAAVSVEVKPEGFLTKASCREVES